MWLEISAFWCVLVGRGQGGSSVRVCVCGMCLLCVCVCVRVCVMSGREGKVFDGAREVFEFVDALVLTGDKDKEDDDNHDDNVLKHKRQ